jgi:cysteine synthase B
MGVSRFLKEQNRDIQVIGAQPEEGSQIPGIRKWPPAYLPRIFDASRVDRTENVSQADAEDFARRLAREEGIFGGISSGGACAVALRVSERVRNATIVFVVCDRGDRYLSTGVFPA